MVHQVTRFSDAYSAWESWNANEFSFRSKQLLSVYNSLDKKSSELSSVVSYHLECARTLLDKTHELVGPTGETNELYTSGRGVVVLMHDATGVNAQQILLAQLTAALAAGNSVVLCSDDSEVTQLIGDICTNLPAHLVQVAPFEAYHQLLEANISGAGYIGSANTEQEINRQLAQRGGALIGLVSETDFEQATCALDPHLCLRFITERTRTINITAVGGNATLLELGSDSH